MSDTPTVHAAMGRVLAALPAIGKNQRNVQQGFNFRGIDDVLNALNPLLSEHGVIIVPHQVLERVAEKRQTKSGSVMFEVNLRVQYRIYGPAGDFIEAEGWGEGTDSGDKATPKAMTGAYKYVLFQSFAISTEEASKHEADRHTPEEAVPVVSCPEFSCDQHARTKKALIPHLVKDHGWTESGGKVHPPSPVSAGSPPAGTGGSPGRAPAGDPAGSPGEGPSLPSSGSPPMTDPQRRRLMVLCGERGLGERQARLDWASDTLGRFVESFSTLTKDEAHALQEALAVAPVAPTLEGMRA